MIKRLLTTQIPALATAFARMLAVLSLLGAAPAVASAQNGTVNGTVTRADNGAGLSGGSVTFCAPTSQCVDAGTNASGAYSISLAPGTYFALTDFSIPNLVNEIYDDVKCVRFCDPTAARRNGTPIQVVSGGTLTRNFALSSGGAYSGVVTDAVSGAPIAGIGVQASAPFLGSRNAFFGFGSTTTDAAGAYSFGGLPTGVYFAETFKSGAAVISTAAPLGYVHEIFDDLCANCGGVASGTAIGVTIGAVTPGIDFALAPGGRITGRVRRADTLASIPDVSVSAYELVGQTLHAAGSASTNASGDYSIAGLRTGTYFLTTLANEALDEIYDNVPCVTPCFDPALHQGTPIAVTQGATTSGKDFLLDGGGLISGTVLAAGTAAPLTANIQIYRQVGTGAEFVRGTLTTAAGNYAVRGLAAGNYFALARAQDRVTQVYGGQPCFFPCDDARILAGQAIPVAVAGTTANINFALNLDSSLSGKITDAATAALISGASVSVYRSGSNTPVATRLTNNSGTFSVPGLPPGTYFITASASEYASEVFNNRVCAGTCSPTEIFAGSPLVVSSGISIAGLNFGLAPRPTVPGPPTGLSAARSTAGVTFTWFAPTSGGVATSYVLEAGLSPGATAITLGSATTSLTVPGVPPGTFFVRVRGANALGAGSPSTEYVLTANAGGIVPDAPRFLVASTSAGRLTVTWAAPNLGPVDGYVLEVGTATGLSNIAVINVATRSFVFDPVPSGFFFFRVRTRAGVNLSAPSNEMMINPGDGPAPPSPPLSFAAGVNGTTVSFTWEAPLLGTATSYVLEAGTAAGLSNITPFNTGSAATTLVVPGVPPGKYFVRLRAANALGISPVSNEIVVVVSP